MTEWLLEQGAAVNAVDRFRRTPLEEAVRGDFAEVAKLLIDKGGKIQEGGKVFFFLMILDGGRERDDLSPPFFFSSFVLDFSFC